MSSRLPIVALLLVAGCRRSAPPPAPVPPTVEAAVVATCASLQGEVSERRPGAPYWEPVKVGSVFRLADWVRTGELSTAKVEFLSGGGLELEPKTIVVVDRPPSKKPGEFATPRVALQQGSVHGFLTEDDDAPTLTTADGREVKLSPAPGQTAEYRLEQRNGTTEIAVLDGAARIETEAGEQKLVAGQFARLGASGVAEEPEQLIAFPLSIEPVPDARFRGLSELSVELSWREVPGASGYRVQVARDLSFKDLMVNEDVAKPVHTFQPGETGMFVWRVASRDRDGRLGEYGYARRIFTEIESAGDRPAAAREAVMRTAPGSARLKVRSARAVRVAGE